MIAPGLRILFCGINPGLYSAALGHHFAGPSNRFWPTLYAAGFTPRLFSPLEDAELPRLGLGITNLVSRTTAQASTLSASELKAGARRLRKKLERYRPKVLAVVGLGAYRTSFGIPQARIGLQAETIGSTRVWLLPNPSGLNAHHQPALLARLFRELRAFAKALP
ncbi:MAG TPA: G/U mismatch-specific DNA glycosylase [Kofleriaceae bacterium]|nr:G/U mismatch-specific DNA glycosylase [Kofleriaceae bacterium]